MGSSVLGWGTSTITSGSSPTRGILIHIYFSVDRKYKGRIQLRYPCEIWGLVLCELWGIRVKGA